MLKSTLIFGAGNNFIYSCSFLEKKYNIVGVADNSNEKQGNKILGYEIHRLEYYKDFEYDFIILTPSYVVDICAQLKMQGVPSKKIIMLEDALENSEHCKNLQMAILFYGGMGDFIVGKNWLCCLRDKINFGNVDIDLYFDANSLETGKNIFSDCEWINCIYETSHSSSSLIEKEYDLVIWFSILPFIKMMNEKYLYDNNKDLFEYANNVKKFGLEYYNEGFFSSPGFYKTVHRIFKQFPEKKYHTHCDLFGDLDIQDKFKSQMFIGIDEDEYLNILGVKKKQFITIDTGLNQEYKNKKNTRAWSHENWDRLAHMLKESKPELKIVQMGSRMSDSDDIYADVNINGKTTLEEAKVLMKNSLVHIDYEGGLVHLRHALKGGVTVVLFGSTSPCKHEYDENVSIRTSACECACEWESRDWLVACPRGYEIPKCMSSITPIMVCDEVNNIIEKEKRRIAKDGM